MQIHKRRKIKIIIGIVSIFLFGTLGYYIIEDQWTLLESFYMVVITITTVGFGEIHDLSPAGRIFTALLIFTGVGTIATLASQFARFIIEGELKGIFGRKKMQDKIKNIKDHYIVCGYGKNGSTVCLKLYENDIPFVVIDSDEEALERAEQRGYLTIKGESANDITLLSAGIERASGIVTCISNDVSTIFVAIAARELNPRINIIAQSTDPAIETRMLRAGVGKVIYPHKLGGEQIARMVASRYGMSTNIDRRSSDFGVMGYYLKIFKHFGNGKITIREALEKADALYVAALRTQDGKILERPSLDTEITKSESLVLLVQKKKDIPQSTGARTDKEITWSEELRTGIQSIDEEHRSLILLINDFHKSLFVGDGREKIVDVFEKLLDYTVTHFKNEEELMHKYDYTETDRQVREHRELTEEVMELNKDKKYLLQENISDFLNSWLRNHIMDTDKKFGKFLSDQGIK